MRLKRKRTSWLLAVAAVVAVCCLVPGCDDEKPTEPVPAKEYTVYFYDGVHNDGNWYFAYKPSSNSIDSVWLPYEAPPVISADGRLMYVSNQVDDVIDVLELDSFTVVDQLPYIDLIAVSPDNQLIAVYRDGLYLLRTSDYSVYLYDSSRSLSGGVFSSNSLSFYYVPQAGGIRRYDLQDTQQPPTEIRVPFGIVRHVAPSLDESRLFLYLHIQDADHYFAVLDIGLDSIVFDEYIWPGGGELALTPNGHFVFYSHGGSMIYGPGPPWLSVYDVQSNQIHTTITSAGILPSPDEHGVPLTQVCCTPDGQWLVALPDRSWPIVVAVDLRTLKISKFLDMEHYFLEGLNCQSSTMP